MNSIILEGRIATKPMTNICQKNKLEIKLILEVNREKDKKQPYDLITVTARNKCAKKLLEIAKINDFIKIKGIIQGNICFERNGLVMINQQIVVKEILENTEQTYQNIIDEADSWCDEIDMF